MRVRAPLFWLVSIAFAGCLLLVPRPAFCVDPDVIFKNGFEDQIPVITAFDFRVQGDPTLNPPLPVSSPYATFDFSAHDDFLLRSFCLKLVYSPIAPPTPSASDACWRRFDAPVPGIPLAAVIDVVDYPFRLGFLASPLYVRLWVKDDAGQVSASAVRQADYNPGTPPSVDNVFATTSNAPCSPLADSDSTVPSDEAVTIKWLANIPNGEAAGGGIELDYTEDGTSYVPIPGAQNLTNAAGSGCTLAPSGGNASCPAGPFESSPKSGCYLWPAGAPKPTGYFGVRVRATDSRNITSVREAVPPLNGRIRFLAGNPDPGIGGNASTTVINNRLDRRYGLVDPGALAVSSRGVVYLRDRDNGILWINPQNGVLARLGTLGAYSFGDGGPAVSAVWQSPQFIAIDFADRLLVWDNDRIRRVNVDSEGMPFTVDTFIGGGSDGSNSGIAPLEVHLLACGLCDILPMPNGDVFTIDSYFYRRSIAGHIRRYRAASDSVDAIDVTGIGYSLEPARNLDDCTFSGLMLEQDVATSTVVRLHAKTQPSVYGSVCEYGTATLDENGAAQAVQLPSIPNVFGSYGTAYRSGLDGQLYAWDSVGGGGIYRFDRASNQWLRVLGDGTRGVNACPDGTEALSCSAEVNDFFVDTFGNLYFISLGQLRVVVASLENDGLGGLIEKRRVRTLVGQGLYYGDGGDALSARFSMITSAKRWIDGSQEKIVVHDLVNARMREVTVGGPVATIAGNGNVGFPVLDVDAKTTPIATSSFTRMGVEPTSGRLYATVGYAEILYLERTGGTWMWRHLAGMGTVPYASASDGETSVQLRGTEFFALTPTSVLYVAYTLDPTLFPATYWGDGFILGFDTTTGALSRFIGQPGADTGSFCADGTLRANCGITVVYYGPNTDPSLDTGGPGDSDDRYVMTERNSLYSSVLRTVPANNPLAAVGTLTVLPTSNFSSFAYVRRADLGGAEVVYYCPPDGTMHRKELSPTQVDDALPWPVPGMRCTGNSLVWNEARHSLTFAYKRWGLYGVAEYVDVP